MALVVNTNVSSLNAQRNLVGTNKSLTRSIQRLSSGLRINSAKDDAAGLAISDRMNSQVRGLNQAVRNANDGISLAQTAEGALQESTNILQRMRELAVQSANDSNTGSDRASIQKEVNQLQQELERIANTTTFNGKTLLDGTFVSQRFHIGAYANQTITVDIGNTRTNAIGSYEAKTQYTTSGSIAAVASGTATTNAANNVDAQTLTIQGSLGTDSVSVGAGDSAKTIAQAITDKSDSTGVTAEAVTYAKIDHFLASGGTSDTISLTIDGSDSATVSATIDETDLTNMADAINAVAGKTGVSATLSDDKASIVLTNTAGEDINVRFNSAGIDGSSLDVTGLQDDGETEVASAATLDDADDNATVGGTVIFDSAKSYNLSTTDTTGGLLTADLSATLNSVSDIDVSSRSGSNDAIKIIDGALSLIDDIRGDLGAVQNRFESTISNLMNVSENISAAKSRIMDADFAQETANMTRAQILQQSGTAMLAQANTLPQAALTLLQ